MLKIAFLCGSLEHGADGVGDYAFRLAEALRIHGADCICIALNDRYVKCQNNQFHSSCSASGVKCYRISAKMPWIQRKKLLRKLVASWRPDWISLQYVPYAFDNKGLPWRLLPLLRSLQPLAKWHVMAHELWVEPSEGLKNRFIAAAQKNILRLLLHAIHPSLIHTTNSYYLHWLSTIGRSASILPLFSNIPVVLHQRRNHASEHSWVLVFFGGIHGEWNPLPFFQALEAEAINANVSSVSVVSIGNAGAYGKHLWTQLPAMMPVWMTFDLLGALPASEISRHLVAADWGVTSTPTHLLGKSGSVAAMLAHHLLVIVPRVEKAYGPWHEALMADQRFIPLDANFGRRLRNRLTESDNLKNDTVHQLPAIAEQFLVELTTA
jgi:hypothetical protein